MVWHRIDNKTLSEPMITQLIGAYICVAGYKNVITLLTVCEWNPPDPLTVMRSFGVLFDFRPLIQIMAWCVWQQVITQTNVDAIKLMRGHCNGNTTMQLDINLGYHQPKKPCSQFCCRMTVICTSRNYMYWHVYFNVKPPNHHGKRYSHNIVSTRTKRNQWHKTNDIFSSYTWKPTRMLFGDPRI